MSATNLALIVFGAVNLAAFCRADETGWDPSGKPLQELLRVIREPGSATARCQAAEAIATYGGRAVAPLCELLEQEHESSVIPDYVCLALTRIGPEAQAAVPLLIDTISNPHHVSRVAAATALESIGPGAVAAVPALRQLVDEEDYSLRRTALTALIAVGDSTAIDALSDAFSRGDARVRMDTMDAFRRTPQHSPAMASVLLRAAIDSDFAVADAALGQLSGLGSAAVPVMIEGLASNQPELRRSAAMSLAANGPAAAPAVVPLAAALSDSSPDVRYWAARALGRIGSPARSAEAALLACLSDPDADVRWQAARTLSHLGLAAGRNADRQRNN